MAALRAATATVRDENVTLLTAGIAYYAFVSLVPLLLLTLGVASLVGGEALADRVVDATERTLTPEARELLQTTLTAGAAAGGATLVGLAVLTWSGLRLFRALDKAFSQVYGVEGGGLLDELRDGLVVLVAIGLGVASVAAAGGALGRLAPGPVAALLARLMSLLTLVVALLPLYYVFPDVSISVRAALPGTVLAAVGWSLLGSVFGVYADLAGGSVYGVLGAALLVVTWLYVGALVVMVGAVVNATLAGVGADMDADADANADRQVQQASVSPLTAMVDDESGAGTSDADESTPVDDGVTAADDSPSADRAGEATDRPSDPPSMAGEVSDDPETDAETAESIDALWTDVARLREQLDEMETRLDERTVSRSALEGDLRRYVRARVRRGHARGWGPYLVLLYGTAMTLGAFFYLHGVWAVGAMLVVWLSTLGLYVLMVLVGMGLGLAGGLGTLRDVVGRLRR
ncbi:hypothetical protein BRD13_03580 [Halobacteriales archaeon SW_5_70_135]|nr:MAG: hypothetical protein BRD13_03580 [Halobacteriales archaeon SW_5_70_135]